MARETNIQLRDQIIYSVYVRSHTKEGTFNAIAEDLGRIKRLGVDTIWFMPIHPIGVKGKKGSLGCPYANRDYRDVNPAYGSMKDFKHLIDAIHEHGMKCMIDVVYNHTSPDSKLSQEHPDWFYHKPDGSFGNRIGDWTDVIDLDYSNRALWDYQIESLVQWACLVDGFRCDVAPLVPLEFWEAAREAVKKVNPDCIWLAESVHRGWALFNRRIGIPCTSDYEGYKAFDMEYEYDVREAFEGYLRGETSLSHYVDLLNFQEAVYPENYIKLRFLENHDVPRICSFVTHEDELINFTAMLYFLKGATMLYAGQEFQNDHQPSLFEREPIDRSTGRDLSTFLTRLAQVKKRDLSCADHFWGQADDERDIAVLYRQDEKAKKLGVFSLKAEEARVAVDFPDGAYPNLLSGERVVVSGGKLTCAGRPIILSVNL